MDEVRIGMVGVGGFGLFCLEQYRRMPGVRVTAIAGTRPEKYARLAAQYGIPYPCADWQALVTHPEVDLVHLATPPHLRRAPALAAFAAGKHVFCEKPLALTLEEADAMLVAADAGRVRLGINFVMRYNPLYAALHALVREGVLGAPQRLVFENYAGDLPGEHWFWDPARSGTILVEHGVHFFDIMGAILGSGRLRWAGRTCRADGAEDKWQAVVQYGDQVLGSFYHAFDKPSPVEETRCVLDCERGRVQLDGWIPYRMAVEGLVTPVGAERLAALLPGAELHCETRGDGPWYANGQRVEATEQLRGVWDADSKEAIYAQAVRAAMADFIDWTRDRSHLPRVTGEDGRAALALALRARTLARRDAA